MAQQVLRAGTDVVLDWSQWNRTKRAEWSQRALQAGWRVLLHYVATPSDVAIERAAARTADYSHPIDGDGVRHMALLFEEPSENEGFPVVLHAEPQPPHQDTGIEPGG